MAYKYTSAHDWLSQAVTNGTVTANDLVNMISNVDSDVIQEHFESQMEVDGYFEDDEDTEESNNKIRIAGHNVEYWYDDEWDHEIEHDDSDFEHIKDLLIDDFYEGEVVTCDNETEETHYGWWKKV